MNEVFYVESGEVVLYWQGPDNSGEVKRIVMQKGSVLTVELDEWHELRNESSETAHLFYFGVLASPSSPAKNTA